MSVEEQTRDALRQLERRGELTLDDEEIEYTRIFRTPQGYTIVTAPYQGGVLDLTDDPLRFEGVGIARVELEVRSFYRTLEQLMSL